MTINNLGIIHSSSFSLTQYILKQSLSALVPKYIPIYPLLPSRLLAITCSKSLSCHNGTSARVDSPVSHFPNHNTIQILYSGPERLTQYSSAYYSSSPLNNPSPLSRPVALLSSASLMAFLACPRMSFPPIPALSMIGS